MKIGVLTSSRADYGIYVPLLKKLQQDPYFQLEIVAFGSHLSADFGYTVEEIESDGFKVKHRLATHQAGDQPQDIALHMAKVIEVFAKFWSEQEYDLILTLGDRFEMFAAVTALVPFNLKVAHIHGGETTLGAIDNVFRHSISLMSVYHFASTEVYKKRIEQLVGNPEHVYNVGALSIDNLQHTQLLSLEEFQDRFEIDLSLPSILITFHPETVSYQENEQYTRELVGALAEIDQYQLIITMPNADTMGQKVRSILFDFINRRPDVKWVESFGRVGYLTCMQHCNFLLGNTSSGFVEASFFPKFVINLGRRQEGRLRTPHIIDTPITKEAILEAVATVSKAGKPPFIDAYGDGTTAEQIVSHLKQI